LRANRSRQNSTTTPRHHALPYPFRIGAGLLFNLNLLPSIMNFSASQITSPWNPIKPFGCDSTSMPDRVQGLGLSLDDTSLVDPVTSAGAAYPNGKMPIISTAPLSEALGMKPQLTSVSIVNQSRYVQKGEQYLARIVAGQFGLSDSNIPDRTSSFNSQVASVERKIVSLLSSIPGANQTLDSLYIAATQEYRRGHYPYTNPPEYWAAALHSPPYVP
jgi:hypothetical protein